MCREGPGSRVTLVVLRLKEPFRRLENQHLAGSGGSSNDYSYSTRNRIHTIRSMEENISVLMREPVCSAGISLVERPPHP